MAPAFLKSRWGDRLTFHGCISAAGPVAYGSAGDVTRNDVMNAGTQLDSNSMVLSFEEPAGYDPETDEEIPLGDMLAGSDDDPAGAAARSATRGRTT